MKYHEHGYDVFVLKGLDVRPDLWAWSRWESLASLLAPFVKLARGKAAVRCLQYSPDPKKMVAFGKLSWNAQSHMRWAHGSPVNADGCAGWTFLSMETWAPGWTVCEKELIPPDFYFRVKAIDCRRKSLGGSRPFVVCAMASALGADNARHLESVLSSLAASLPASVFAHKRRPWGIGSLGAGSFTYAVQDMNESVLSGAQEFDRMRKPFDEDLLPETWRVIDFSRS